jgi:hypothetical protein
MAIGVAASETTRQPGQEYVRMRRRRGGGELDEMEELFEQLMGGEELEDVEGLEDFDWEGLWESFMEGEGEREEGGVPQQASDRPTMFGSPIRPGGFNTGLGMNYY